MERSPDGTDDRRTATCARCGSSIDTSDWYPVATDEDRIVPFCSVACRSAWLEAAGAEQGG